MKELINASMKKKSIYLGRETEKNNKFLQKKNNLKFNKDIIRYKKRITGLIKNILSIIFNYIIIGMIIPISSIKNRQRKLYSQYS